MNKKTLRLLLILMLSIGLAFPAFTCPKCDQSGVSKLDIWVSEVANACGTFQRYDRELRMTILDCNGILNWNCGRFLAPDGTWQPVPNGKYWQLPFKCGHLEVEVPPGYYWVVAGYHIFPEDQSIRFNFTTHVGIVQVDCGKSACIKLFNPSILLCWEWFRQGLRMQTIARSQPPLDPRKVKQIEMLVDELLKDIPAQPVEREIKGFFQELYNESKEKQQKQQE